MTTVRSWGLITMLLVALAASGAALAAKAAYLRLSQPQGATEVSVAAGSSFTTDKTIGSLEARLASRPSDVRTYSTLGGAYLQKARETSDPSYYKLAEQAMDRALAQDPQNIDALVGMGSLALARHQFREALQWGERARALAPYSARILGVIGDAHVELGEYEGATSTFQRMVDLRPDLSSYSRVSYLRELTGDIPGAMDVMERALAAGSPFAENTNWTRVQIGNLHFNSGDLDGAETLYRAALQYYPGYLHAQAGMAKVMAARGRYVDAIALYQQAVEQVPFPGYVIALGDVYAAAGRTDQAAKMYALVRVQERLYQANGVNTDLEIALFDADHGQDLPQALAYARQEMARRPSILAADVLGWTLYQNGEYQEASLYAQEALKLGTKDALMLFHAGMVTFKLGRFDEAKGYLGQALALNPNFSVLYRDEARRTLNALDRSLDVRSAT